MPSDVVTFIVPIRRQADAEGALSAVRVLLENHPVFGLIDEHDEDLQKKCADLMEKNDALEQDVATLKKRIEELEARAESLAERLQGDDI